MSAPLPNPRYEPLLAAIAQLLDVPVDAFFEAAGTERTDATATALFAGMLATDPQFLRLAQAYLDVQDLAGRRAIADAVVSIAGAFNLKQAQRGGTAP